MVHVYSELLLSKQISLSKNISKSYINNTNKTFIYESQNIQLVSNKTLRGKKSIIFLYS